MIKKLQKTVAIACLVSLITASVSAAVDEKDNQGSRARSRRVQNDRNRSERGTNQGRPGRGYGGEMMGARGMGPGSMGMAPGRGMQEIIPEMIRQRLKLTEEQNKKLQDIRQKHSEKNQQLSKLQLDLRTKLDDAIDKGNKDAIAKIAQDMGKNIADTALLQVSGKDSLKQILNEDQVKIVERFYEQRAERRERMRNQMEQRMSGKDQPSQKGRRQDQDTSRKRGRDRTGDEGSGKRERRR